MAVNVAEEYFNGLFNYDNEIIMNDIDSHVIELLEFFSKHDIEEILEKISFYIKKYGLSETDKYGYTPYLIGNKKDVSNYNREKYIRLREDYNSRRYLDDSNILFYLLIVFGFNNQIRFNSKGKFNLPVGKRDFNSNMKNKLLDFHRVLSTHNFNFSSRDFRLIDGINHNDFVYADPPYRITTATYSEQNKWTLQDDLDLFCFLDRVNDLGAKFAMSNVIIHNGKANEELIKWSEKYLKYSSLNLDFNYNNSNYQSKAKNSKTVEVLIKNY